MNGPLLQAASPSRRPNKNRGGGGGSSGGNDGNRLSRGTGSGRGRGRGAGGTAGGSRLASSKPITQSDLSSANSPFTNGDGGFDSSDESEAARQERFSKTDPGNQYEQVMRLLNST